MRLWNLVTGKKAGVLNFDKQLLQSVKEGKYSSGEGRKIRWHPNGEEFAVTFERGAIVFGADSKARCRALPYPLTKVHQLAYLDLSLEADNGYSLLTASTEDGRVVFYSTSSASSRISGSLSDDVEDAPQIAQLGGRDAGISGRIKDYQFVHISLSDTRQRALLLMTAGSDGMVRAWHVATDLLTSAMETNQTEVISVGKLLGTHDTHMRVTCLGAYLMQEPEDDAGISEFEGLTDGDDVETNSES